MLKSKTYAKKIEMPFDTKKIKQDSKIDYEKAWLDTKSLLQLTGNYFNLEKKGKSHLISDFIFDARDMMISLGFEELILPMFVDEHEVYKQYGPEAALILDRLFYLAGLPRPDIGISKEKINLLKKFIPHFHNIDELKNIFREYKKGEIEADNLIEAFIERLELKETEATTIIDNVFLELKNLKPIPTNTTLKSHTTALWFIVLKELYKKKNLPLQYFSISPKFRREQRIDATHLYCSNTISLVIMAEEISLEDCQTITSTICEKIGFKSNKLKIKKATSKYYAPQTEFEIFIKHPKTEEWLEIGDGGLYSPVSLAQYNLEYPVFNVGFGVERICMIKSEIDDIRKLVYPYFYEDITFTDEEISGGISYKFIPVTEEGIEIKNAIIQNVLTNKDVESPIEIKVWEGMIKGKKLEVKLWENDQGVKLVGPAALNKVWVKDGNIFGLDYTKKIENGIDSGKTYLEGIASQVAYNIETLLDQNQISYEYRLKICYRASEVNLVINDKILEYIHSKQKKIDIRGPVFIGLSFNVIN
ncbi:MAG: O-phosphoserine--tRNA ligase [Promethearchaeota archaeon]